MTQTQVNGMLMRPFGKSGWNVSAIGFGAWGIGGQWGEIGDEQAIATTRAAVEAGMNFIDTADAYGAPVGRSEMLVGKALASVRDKVFIATKVGNWARRLGHPLSYATPEHVILCCHASLHRLGMDYIDLYQCHIGNCKSPEVFLEAFDRLIEDGKIRAFGVSTDDLQVLQGFCRDPRCASVQLEYSLLDRRAEKELLPWCQQNGIAVLVRGPLHKGVCAGKFTAQTRFDDSVREGWNEGEARQQFLRNVQAVEQLRFLERPERTLAQAALQFVIGHPAVTVAIPGAKNPQQACANAAASRAVLDPDELDRVRQITGG
jgi:myo-inositol catabolism protein IolS